MKKIDSQALDILKQAFGLSGATSPVTELTDGVVDQVIDVRPIVRRSRTQAQTEGLYTGVLRNVHPGADSRTATLNPYNAGATANPPYPAPMPRGFDIWLLSAFLTQLSGSGTLSAALRVIVPATKMGLDTLGAPVAATMNTALWDSIVAEGVATVGVKSGQTETMQKIGIRLPRSPDTQLSFGSTSGAAATFDCFVILGVFPVGLGQDAIV